MRGNYCMLEKYTFKQPDNTDLNLNNCGLEDCSPLHRWGPGMRDHYLVHIVLAGQGVYKSPAGIFRLSAGQGFLISPSEIVEYVPDNKNPWSYLWAGFHGLRAGGLLLQAGISGRKPVFAVPHTAPYRELVEKMLVLARVDKVKDLRLLGTLYFFLARLVEDLCPDDKIGRESMQEEYLRQAVRLMVSRYSGPVKISEIAAHIGLDRSYLYTLFRKHLNMTPKEYLTQLRLSRAVELLQTPLSISEIAWSVGYDDPLLFAKAFKKMKGVPPSKFREEHFN